MYKENKETIALYNKNSQNDFKYHLSLLQVLVKEFHKDKSKLLLK